MSDTEPQVDEEGRRWLPFPASGGHQFTDGPMWFRHDNRTGDEPQMGVWNEYRQEIRFEHFIAHCIDRAQRPTHYALLVENMV